MDASLFLKKKPTCTEHDEIAEARDTQAIIEGLATDVIKGGLLVDIGGIKAFLPSSHIDVRPVKNLEQFLGKQLKIKVIKLIPRKTTSLFLEKLLLNLKKIVSRAKHSKF